MKNYVLGTYHPGNSFLHRTPAVLKILVLIAWILAVSLGCRQVLWLSIPGAIAIILLFITRVPVRIVWEQVWPTLPLLVLIGLYQWWAVSWQEALRITGIILCCILAAIVISLTTRVTEMLDGSMVLLRPLAKLKVPTERIALAFALTVQSVPVISAIVTDVQESLWSRDGGCSLRAFITPVLSRVLRHADGVGDALLARGMDDSDSHHDSK